MMNCEKRNAMQSIRNRASTRWRAVASLIAALAVALGFTVSAAPAFAAAATHFSITGAPASVFAGTSFNVTVTAQDGTNVTDTGFVGVTIVTSSDGAAVLPSPN